MEQPVVKRQTVEEEILIKLRGWSQSPATIEWQADRGEIYLQEQIYVQNRLIAIVQYEKIVKTNIF